MRSRVLVLVVLLLGVPATPASGSAGLAAPDQPVRLGRSIGAVSLGQTVRGVAELLGHGRTVRRDGSPFGVVVVRTYPAHGLRVSFTGGRATYVQARFARYRTARGVRVGSSLAALRRAYPAVERLAPRVWVLGRLEPGGRVTDFRLDRRGQISVVGVGIVLD